MAKNNEALGMIETKGFVSLVEATDAKTARHWAEELARTVAAPAPAEED